MTRRERLLNSLTGKPVDRPPVSFYELNGLDENPADPDPFNIFADPSWKPLLDLTRDQTDRIVMRGVGTRAIQPDALAELTTDETQIEQGSRFIRRTVRAPGRKLTQRTRQDPDVNTVWTLEHLLKDSDDLHAFLRLPPRAFQGTVDPTPVLAAEAALGDSGIVMIDTPDPLCLAASLFDMAEYTVTALTEPVLFRALLERFATWLLPHTAAVAAALPGRLWRIYGPEYAAPPYLPPHLFREYVGTFVTPMIAAIHRHGGYARIHCHGNVQAILPDIVAMGADALDPLEPPPQGDVELRDVRRRYGRELTLFGNLEIADLENLPPERFAEKVRRALDEGTAGDGRGFVLMPSACPYGRQLAARTLRNYETMVRLVNP